MEALTAFFDKLGPDILARTYEHVYLTFFALFFAVIIALPLGIVMARSKWEKAAANM